MPVDPYIARGMPDLGADALRTTQRNREIKRQQSNIDRGLSMRQQEQQREYSLQQKKTALGVALARVIGSPDPASALESLRGPLEQGLSELTGQPVSGLTVDQLPQIGQMFGIKAAEQKGAEGAGIGNVNPGDYTPESLSAWAASRSPQNPNGDFSLLKRQYAPQLAWIGPMAGGIGAIPRGGGGVGAPQMVVSPEAQIGGEAAGAAATTRATEEAKAGVASEAKAREAQITGQKTWEAFDQAMTAHEKALGGTVTGPVTGRVPAVTSAQQKAVASKAALAPILKQIFRSAGEGIFTDKDQQLLLEMMPDRTLNPEARQFAAENVRNIVRAKLGLPTNGAVSIETDDQYDMLPSGTEFVGPDGVKRRKP